MTLTDAEAGSKTNRVELCPSLSGSLDVPKLIPARRNVLPNSSAARKTLSKLTEAP